MKLMLLRRLTIPAALVAATCLAVAVHCAPSTTCCTESPGPCYTISQGTCPAVASGTCQQSGYAAMPWEPPSAWGQGLCSATQLQRFVSDCFEGIQCDTWLTDPTNAVCMGCLISPVGHGHPYGPVLQFPWNGSTQMVLNFGGCASHGDGHAARGSCGNTLEDYAACLDLECGNCSSYDECIAQARGGDCAPFASPECHLEYSDGGAAAVCNDFTSFFTLWCGAADAGIGDGGGPG